jgi:hypothetical protein
MNTRFDPLHNWLGIPPDQQPPSYYQLLGIPELESNVEVIEAAAAQRTIYLRTFRTDQHLQLAEQLLNLISAAQTCLLNSQSKARYDDQLRVSHEAKAAKVDPLYPPTQIPAAMPVPMAFQPPASPVGSPSPPPIASLLPVAKVPQPSPTAGSSPPELNSSTSPSAIKRHRQRRKKSNVKSIILASTATFAIFAVVIYLAMQPKKRDLISGKTAMARKVSPPDVRLPIKRPVNPRIYSPADGPADGPVDGPADGPVDEKAFDQTWVVIYDALREQYLPEAEKQLLELNKLATTAELRDKFRRLELLFQYVKNFENLWSQSLAQVESGDELIFGPNQFMAVVEVTSIQITIKDRGELKRYSLKEISPHLELAIIETYFDMRKAGSLMAAGAHYATRPETTAADITKAREYWGRAARLNASNNDFSIVLVDNDTRPQLTERENSSTVGFTGKATVPGKEELGPHFALLESVYKKDLAEATTPDSKKALAVEVFDLSWQEVDSNEERYAILWFAYKVARDGGHRNLTDRIRDRLDQFFAINILALRLEDCVVWERLIPTIPRPEDRPEAYRELVTILQEVGTLAEDAADYALATQAYKQGLALSRRATMKASDVAAFTVSLKRVELAAARDADVRLARETLKQDPEDPEANLKIGEYLAFNQDSWPEALPYLVKGSNPLLSQLAQREQQAPKDSVAMEELGDAWCNFAEDDVKRIDRATIYRRAIFWYREAIANSGSQLRKLAIQKKIDRILNLEASVRAKAIGNSPVTFASSVALH